MALMGQRRRGVEWLPGSWFASLVGPSSRWEDPNGSSLARSGWGRGNQGRSGWIRGCEAQRHGGVLHPLLAGGKGLAACLPRAENPDVPELNGELTRLVFSAFLYLGRGGLLEDRGPEERELSGT